MKFFTFSSSFLTNNNRNRNSFWCCNFLNQRQNTANFFGAGVKAFNLNHRAMRTAHQKTQIVAELVYQVAATAGHFGGLGCEGNIFLHRCRHRRNTRL